jgi:hypothetical protein
MSNCAACGRPRTGTAQFCAGCGSQFSDASDTPAQAAAQPPEPQPTRWDTRWYRPDAAPAGAARPGPAAGPVPGPAAGPVPALAAGPSAAGWGAAAPGTAGPQPPPGRRGRSGLLIALLVVVVLAVGGGAFALVSAVTGKNNAQSTPPASSPPASGTASGGTTTPTARPTPDASATRPAGTSVVAVSSAAKQNAAAAQVKVLLDSYFAAINTKDYAAYSSLLDAQMQEPESSFASGYRTTEDTAETLTSLTDTGGGSLAATVSFTSRQNPADSIYHMACTVWTITLYLQPASGQASASGYLIGAPPSGYQPTHQSCP